MSDSSKVFDVQSLMNQYGPKIFNMAYRMVGDEADAEDIVQDTFITVFEKINTFRGESAIYTWIYKIAVNICLGHKKEKAQTVNNSYEETEKLDTIPVPDDIETGLSRVERELFMDDVAQMIRLALQ